MVDNDSNAKASHIFSRKNIGVFEIVLNFNETN